MDILIRTDASVHIGSGHVMRCLTLADELRNKGREVGFICRKILGNLIEIIQQKGYQVFEYLDQESELITKPFHIDWEKDLQFTKNVIQCCDKAPVLIVDHYGLDVKWEAAVRPIVQKIMVIDDLADRYHVCDILLDQNYYTNPAIRYNGLTPTDCKLLLGPDYALLRDEFLVARGKATVRKNGVGKILLFFGGSDPHNMTLKVMNVIRNIHSADFVVDVVVGSSNPHKEVISDFCLKNKRFKYYCQVDNISELMVEADLAVGAGGSTSWERCYLGLPTLVVIIAENQRESSLALELTGASKVLGDQTIDEQSIYLAVKEIIEQPEKLSEMSQKCLEVMDTYEFCKDQLSSLILERK